MFDPVSTINRESGRCVCCGLCLAHCPTYLKTRDEAESPRGRIALMRALAGGELAASPRLISHLELCLACRACERVCPANVGYGELIDAGRALVRRQTGNSLAIRALRAGTMELVTRAPRTLRTLARLLRVYQRSGLQQLARAAGLPRLLGLEALENELPPVPRPRTWRVHYPAAAGTDVAGDVALFTGCVGQIVDGPALDAAIRVLNRLGYNVHVPRSQRCCGAIYQHAGEPEKAASLINKNLAAFGSPEVERVITIASGCGATLSEYGKLQPHDSRTEALARKIVDISDFLTSVEWPSALALRPLPKRIAVHDPCTLQNVMRRSQGPYELLRRIPQAEISPLPDNRLCCGAAGTYFLTQRDMAQALRADKIAHIRQMVPDIVVTSNAGCAMHLTNGLRQAGVAIEVTHPVMLIDRQLPPA